MTGGTDELRLSIAWFETAKPNGPALGNSETTTWSNFASIFATWRREGEKGGLNFVPSRFEEPRQPSRVVGAPASQVAFRFVPQGVGVGFVNDLAVGDESRLKFDERRIGRTQKPQGGRRFKVGHQVRQIHDCMVVRIGG